MSPPKVTEQPVEVPPVEDPPVPGAVDTYESVTGVLVLRIFSSYRRMISQKEIRTSGVRISTATHNKRRALLSRESSTGNRWARRLRRSSGRAPVRRRPGRLPLQYDPGVSVPAFGHDATAPPEQASPAQAIQ